MTQLRVVYWPLRFAIAAVLAAVTLVGVTGWRSTRFDGTMPSEVSPVNRSAAELGSYRPPLVSELDRAVEADPFHPERRRPSTRYELPGNAPAEIPQPAPVADPIELLGTVVVAGGRSFAMCQTSAGTQVVHVGDTIAGFTLKSVGQGNAVFMSPNGKVTNMTVKKTGS